MCLYVVPLSTGDCPFAGVFSQPLCSVCSGVSVRLTMCLGFKIINGIVCVCVTLAFRTLSDDLRLILVWQVRL